MRVVRDFEEVYSSQEDPWSIGDATSDRYNLYYDLLKPHAHGAVLDIGCGMGAFLARFRADAVSLDGVELSQIAVQKGRRRFPFVRFHAGSAAELDRIAELADKRFDLIICSDVVYYLDDAGKDRLMAWVAAHLAPEGKALIAGYCPGKKYPTPAELHDLVRRHLKIVQREDFLETKHLALLAAPRRRLVALTFDYETWHPIPEGKHIDWDKDVFEPAERLIEVCGRAGAPITFFAEMGEYLWLEQNQPEIAVRMEEQWRRAVERGHDVQLHLHPCWLPETGASYDNGSWHWDWSKSKAHDYPGDLSALIGRCKAALEMAIRPVKPDYAVTTFRAGAYQAQPFDRISRALIDNGILCDTSVYPGGKSADRGFDYSNAYSNHQPYYADRFDPQLKALPSEEAIVELPVFTPEPGRRWFIDNDEGPLLARRLIDYERRKLRRFSISRLRALETTRKLAGHAYWIARGHKRLVNRLLPRRLAYALIGTSRPREEGDRYYVAIGHTKADLHLAAIERCLQEMRETLGVEHVTISAMAAAARRELESSRRADAGEEAAYQVERETPALLSGVYNDAQSHRLQEMIPFDVDRVLDFGCGAGQWSARIASELPWVRVTGIDAGKVLLDRARSMHGSDRVDFVQGDFARLPFDDASFDCVYADNTLEHSFDLEAALGEINRVLREGGSLVAALPLDGLNPDEDCDNHTWKTVREQALLRIERAGFSNPKAVVIDTYRELGMSPYMPSRDRMIYVRAWKRAGGDDDLARAVRAMDWIYHRIKPGQQTDVKDPKKVIAGGYGLCIASTVALGRLLQRQTPAP